MTENIEQETQFSILLDKLSLQGILIFLIRKIFKFI